MNIIKHKKVVFILTLLILVFSITIVKIYLHSVNNGKKIKNNENNKELTSKQKLEDFEYMYKIFADDYPFFDIDKRNYGIDWLSKKSVYEKEISETKSDDEFENVLNNILKELNNPHTYVLNKQSYDYARAFYNTNMNELNYKPWCDVINSHQTMNRYKANKISNKSSNNLSTNTSTHMFRTDIVIPDKIAYIYIYQFDGNYIESDRELIHKFFEQVKNYPYLIIDIRGNIGGDTRYWMNDIVAPLINKPITFETYYLLRGGSYSQKFMNAKNIKLNDISTFNFELFKNLAPEAHTEFKYYSKNTEVIKPSGTVGFYGKVFLLVDHNNYSSAENFAVFCKSTKWATIVGQQTGGDGIGTDPVIISLPNSGYIVSFPAIYGLNPDGSANDEAKTKPDISVDATACYDLSKDTAVRTIINMLH